MKLYVAYGSNLHLKQMEVRCPGAMPVATGIIENYKLVYRGSKTGAYATIIPDKGSSVPVLIWEINSYHEMSLDRYEGYPNFYYKKIIQVKLNSGQNISGMAYIMFDEARPGEPSMQYLTTIAGGYLDNGLNMDFFKESIAYNQKEIK